MTRPHLPPARPPDEAGQQPVRLVRRSRSDRVIGGVCGGLGRYFGIDPVLLRIAAVALVLSGGLGLLAYLVAWVVIPEADGPDPPVVRGNSRHDAALVVGAALIGVGALLLLRETVPWFGAGVFWPLVVVAVGVLLIASARR